MDYVQLEVTTCQTSSYGQYENVDSAKESCKRDVQCKGVWDIGCDDSLNSAHLCWIGFDYVDDSARCVYDKKDIPEFLLRKKLQL